MRTIPMEHMHIEVVNHALKRRLSTYLQEQEVGMPQKYASVFLSALYASRSSQVSTTAAARGICDFCRDFDGRVNNQRLVQTLKTLLDLPTESLDEAMQCASELHWRKEWFGGAWRPPHYRRIVDIFNTIKGK